MLGRGEIFSVQEFIREAVEDRLERWKREHPAGPRSPGLTGANSGESTPSGKE
jgi:hypothetical protein